MLKYRIWDTRGGEYIAHGEFFIMDDGCLYDYDTISRSFRKINELDYTVEYAAGIVDVIMDKALFVGDVIRDRANDEIYEVMFGHHFINVNYEYEVSSIGFYLKGNDYQKDGAREIILQNIKIIGNIHTDKI